MTLAPLDRQPTLEGGLVALRPLCADDFDALFAVAADPLIWEQHPEPNRWQRPVFERFFAAAIASGGALLAVDRASGAVIGSSRYQPVDGDPRAVEIGWTFVARKFWGGHYNGEMKRLMIDHALRSVDRVIFVIGADNRRSRRAVEKIGATLVGDAPASYGEGRVIYEIRQSQRSSRA
jgi:N-acetyltransferase